MEIMSRLMAQSCYQPLWDPPSKNIGKVTGATLLGQQTLISGSLVSATVVVLLPIQLGP